MPRLHLVLALAALAGCTRERVAGDPAAIPPELAGVWSASESGQGAFVALGQRTVTIALPGLERRSAAPSSCSAEPGLGAGEIRLVDGTRLFVACGSEPRERRAGGLRLLDNARWLDVTVERPDQPAVQRRLWWTQSAAAPVALADAIPAAAVAAPAPAVAPAPVAPADAALAAAAPARRADALALAGLRAGGADRGELAELFAQRQARAWRLELERLDAARSDPGGGHLAAAGRLQQDAEAFRTAVVAWLGP